MVPSSPAPRGANLASLIFARLALALFAPALLALPSGAAASTAESDRAEMGSAAVRPAHATDDARAEEPRVDEPESSQPESFADEVDVEAAAPEIPALIGIETRLPMTAMEMPASFSMVDNGVILEQAALTLSDALQNVAGVNVQTGSGTFDTYWIRGFESVAGSLVLVNGAPEPESTFHHLYNVERIEVVKGASGGFLYGGRALAGTLNLVHKQPVGESFGHVHLVAGSESYGQATFDANWPLGDDSGLRLAGLWHSADNFRDDNESAAWAINPTYSWRGERTTVALSLEFVANEFTPDGGLPILGGQLVDVPRRRSYDDPSFDFQEQESTRFQLNVQHQLSDRWQLRTKAFYSDLDWQSAGMVFAGAIEPFEGVGLGLRSVSQLDDRQTFGGVQVELFTDLETGSVRHEILFGTEVARFDDDFSLSVGLLSPVDIGSGQVLGPPGVVQPLPFQTRQGDVSSDVVGAFVFDRISFSDHFQLVLGARWDSIELDGDGTARDRDDDEVSPFVGLVVSPDERVSFYANYAESFEPGSTLAVGEVVPEEGEQVEAGVKLDLLGGALQATLAWYRLEKENIPVVDQFGFPSQTGAQESEGVELEIVGRLADDLDLRFGLARTDAELTAFRELVVFGPAPTDFVILDRSGNTAPFAPDWLMNLWLTKRFGSGWGVGLGSRYIDEQFIAPDNGFAIDDVLLFDAAIFFNWNRAQLTLDLYNLGDEEYETRAQGFASVRPAAGFEGRAGVRLLF